jgi:hypothetical protein
MKETRKKGRKLGKPIEEKAFTFFESKKNKKIIEYSWAVEDQETMLMDLNIWVAETCATVHSTSNLKLNQDWKQDTNKNVIMMGNGQKEEVTKTRNVMSTVKIVKEEFKAT